MVFLLKDAKSKVKVHVHMFAANPRIEIEHREDHGTLAALESVMALEGVSRLDGANRPWVLSCGMEDEDRTGRILEAHAGR